MVYRFNSAKWLTWSAVSFFGGVFLQCLTAEARNIVVFVFQGENEALVGLVFLLVTLQQMQHPHRNFKVHIPPKSPFAHVGCANVGGLEENHFSAINQLQQLNECKCSMNLWTLMVIFIF